MSDTRADLAAAFLAATGWGAAHRVNIAGDASNRRYDRLRDADGGTAVLMDAPPAKGESVRPFVRITHALRDLGLSAPQVLAEDDDHGFLLLEDLGDDLFAKVVQAKPALEQPLYEAAVDLLVHLHTAPPPSLPPYDAATATPLAALAFDWYLPGATGTPDPGAKAAFDSACHAVLAPLDPALDVLIQRDYHAENLLWLPDRTGVARVGLLDYQDAMRGHRAYDLMSILQDARRDVPPALAVAMVRRYVTTTGADADAFGAAFACLGMQRNMRILGVFARLSMAYGKPHYVDLIPRVWGHLITALAHPALATVAPLITDHLPAPDPAVLASLKDKCGSVTL
ncbi:phosphotransferase [uncultured Tateyamaria sp.]|uniref:aminoglycoside phosphotransferase family protein n=1 Tax=Tateyamaria sp. 1078 TaxID=3417464 RepID=UPI002617CEE9|nr:phosphotransferase [uncultured Tateyamaria sp.]